MVEVDGVPVTDPRYAVSFEMRYAADARRATVVLDMAAQSDLVDLEEMAAFLGQQRGWTGIPQARLALDGAVENSWSPAETDMRTSWLDWFPGARLLANAPVFDSAGRHVATPDLLDLDRGVVGEYDGELHLTRRRRDRDVRREARMREVGLEVVTMTAADRPDTTDLRLRLAQARARAEAVVGVSRWTLQPPPGWVLTDTVARRRRLTAHRRDEWSHDGVA